MVEGVDFAGEGPTPALDGGVLEAYILMERVSWRVKTVGGRRCFDVGDDADDADDAVD